MLESDTQTHQGSLLLALEEISHLVAEPGEAQSKLATTVKLIQGRFGTDVCSVYMLTPDRANLVLAATMGLRPECVRLVRMRLDEGLAGMVAQEMRPVQVEESFNHPRFKYFKESGEDPYHSFLGVPLTDRGLLQGVLVVQTIVPRTFSHDETRMLVTVAAQLGPIASEVRALDHVVAPTHERLWALARNLWWSWDRDAVSIFRELDPVRWRELHHNPIALLSEMSLEKLEDRVAESVLQGRINYTYRRMQEYLKSEQSWGATHAGLLRARPIAYFSAEFGLHESIPIYSGGLGVLAGDHVKSASDLSIPLVGVGLYYNQGYFRQRIDHNGWQQEDYIQVQGEMLPVRLALDAQGKPIVVTIETRRGSISARVWQVAVGRVTLLLLDSDVEGNPQEDRELTARLYGGDDRVRIRQELMLGVGGYRALRALGICPGVVHLNEGHSAFAALEGVRQRMASEGIAFDEAAQRVASQVTFTTHTPVPAGHDRFSPELMEEHLGPLRDALGLSHEGLMALGRVHPGNHGETFCMTVLAIKLSRRRNAVSYLHGQVSRSMWTELYPGRAIEEVPIGNITNGVHVPSWLAPQMHQVYDRHLGPDWPEKSGEPAVWQAVDKIDDGELWETHLALKAQLLDFVRRHAVRLAELRREPKHVIEQHRRALSVDALTIGFARRFATYKRSDLALRDVELLLSMVDNAQRPIQFIFAGKAHPRDNPGKEIIKRIVSLTNDPRLVGKIVFVEDYDINTCRYLIQGVDVWLNNPRRPLEASGTSGQKVVLNGGLNLSILDGWWAEAYDGSNGFAIGTGETHSSTEVHDSRDAEALLQTLQQEVIPLYYQRDQDGIPRAWIARMKRCIRTLGWRFSAHRMVMDYVQKCYLPAAGGLSSDMPQA